MKKFRTSFTFKVLTVYLSLNLIFPLSGIQTGMFNSYALTGGPSQPEFNSFTPIGTSDMVDLASGDFNYNIPIMDVGGYPLNLSYNSGITMDQEASWVGLGWNLNVGQINRNVRGLPDDFDGDEMRYENNMKKNITVGVGFDTDIQAFSLEALSIGAGITIQHNNYEGVSFKPSLGFGFALSDNISIGMNLESSSYEGVSISPNVNYHSQSKGVDNVSNTFNASVGVGYNSRQGLSSFNLSASKGHKTTAFGDQYSINETSGSSSISFVNNTYTPTKRNAYRNENFAFDFTLGPGFAWVNSENGIRAFGSIQRIHDKDRYEKAYGYQNTENATKNDILDFNRENDNIISRNTLVLPVTNYTYDLHSIQGQGIGGMFRPFRSQVGYVYDQYVKDKGKGGSLGLEFEGIPVLYMHYGVNVTYSPSHSSTGVWNTAATSYFKEQKNNLDIGYEKTYFKTIGELNIDNESANLLNNRLGDKKPIALKIKPDDDHVSGKYASNQFRRKGENFVNGEYEYSSIPVGSKILRQKREIRNTSIQKITAEEVDKYYTNNSTIIKNEFSKAHHTAAYKVLKNDGATYVYGETAYNTKKIEASFATDHTDDDCTTGLVGYSSNDYSRSNNSGKDHYFNKITTPSYAHTYLLTSILSSDYEDIDNNGPTDNDLGSYTKFVYEKMNEDNGVYKWRIPFQENKASFNEGLNTLNEDQKGSIIYGEKEIKYISKVETKTHVAIFNLSERRDGHGVNNDFGGLGSNSKMYKINTIKLYSKPDFDTNNNMATPIKTAHFVYDYSLMPSVLNNDGNTQNDSSVLNNNDVGKLTLKQIYFTYADSNMGKYTPYQFNYAGYNPTDGTYVNNYAYGLKDFDIWGNYNPNTGGCNSNDLPTTSEFPFVQQNDKELQDKYTSAWSLDSIDLPSGGKIELTYETDDYQYVQDRKAMQMLKIAGVTRGSDIPNSNDINSNDDCILYSPGNYDHEAKYLIVEIDNNIDTADEFQQKYIGNINDLDKPIYFRTLINMTYQYEYVEGYFKIDKDIDLKVFEKAGQKYGAIPMSYGKLEGGTDGNKDVNPISKAGWYFGRQYLNKIVGGGQETTSENIVTIAKAIVGAIDGVLELFDGPNGVLRDDFVAMRMKKNKSWIRLNKPNNKLGGGVRIKKLIMNDNWDTMVNSSDDLYQQSYGQQYNYTLENGLSSGVATFEPNSSKENPFVEPFYNTPERLVAPREVSYVEKPFGVSFFPAPQVTYSKVTVKNLERIQYDDDGTTILKHVKTNATGKVVNEFFTSKDFPTIADFTTIDNPANFYEHPSNIGESIADILIDNIFGLDLFGNSELTFSQGFSVTTNDMNGKSSKQLVYNEQDDEISSVKYIYSTNTEVTELKNTLPVILNDGTIDQKEIGTHFDVINDFRQSKSKSKVFGANGNLEIQLIAIVFVPPFLIYSWGGSIIPNVELSQKSLQTAVTTKVMHKTGILKEKIAKDLGATVSTENLAWDAVTGQVIITKTKNEYNDAYYSLNYPAHWQYKQMGLATNNLDIEGVLTNDGDYFNLRDTNLNLISAENILINGDELFVEFINENSEVIIEKFWITKILNDDIMLTDKFGKIVNYTLDANLKSPYVITNNAKFKIIRSGYRNLQSASMASVTTMTNPIDIANDNNVDVGETIQRIYDISFVPNPKFVNASAIEYTDLWSPQCECLGLPNFAYNFDEKTNAAKPANDTPEDFATVGFNPYLYNVKGNYKAVKSYVYLAGRATNDINASPRNDGFFTSFNPFYDYKTIGTTDQWAIDRINWTFASQVSKYSPFGVELENKDALGRYSSAQYGFNYTLPTAVSSNSKYTEMGFDSFEDYQSNEDCTTTHFAYREAIVNDLGNAEIISTESHTGHKSIKVNGGTRATLEKRIKDCTTPDGN